MRCPCSIFFFDGYLGVSPTVLNLLRVLDRDGYDVTVYATRNPFPAPSEAGSHSTVLYLRRLADVPGGRWLARALRRIRSGSLVSLAELALYAAQCSVARPAMRRGRPSGGGLSLGIDTNGVIAAWIRRLFSGAPYAYLSLEIGPSPAFRAIASIVLLLERRAYRGADVVFIQDEERFQALTSYLRYSHPNVVYLPNSPLVSTDFEEPIPAENFLRERCGIAKDAFPEIILQAGMIGDAVLSADLARSFVAIEDGCALVYHERLKRSLDEPYIARLRKINDVNLFMSLDPVPIEELDRVYAAATVGVAFYKTSDANFSLISLASGKLGYYLKHGKPVLVHGSSSLAQFVQERDVGVVVHDPTSADEVREAIDQIRRDYARYSSNARACYEAEFEFERVARDAILALHTMCPPEER